MLKYVIAIGVVMGLALPAFAAEFWVVRDHDKKCRIVESRPTDEKIIVLHDKAYVTREEAETHRKVLCKE